VNNDATFETNLMDDQNRIGGKLALHRHHKKEVHLEIQYALLLRHSASHALQ
jgi:hypothetical protein